MFVYLKKIKIKKNLGRINSQIALFLNRNGFNKGALTMCFKYGYQEIYLDLHEKHSYLKKCLDALDEAINTLSYTKIRYAYDKICINFSRFLSLASQTDTQMYMTPLVEYFYNHLKLKLMVVYEKSTEDIMTIKKHWTDERKIIEHEYRICDTGVRGEERVNRELSLYHDIITNINNVRFEVEGISVESDNILITEKGLFIIEVKNIGETANNMTIRISRDGRWEKIINRESKVMDNITSQINRHIGLKQRFINSKLSMHYGADSIPYFYLNPIIVIANENVNIENECDIPVVRVSNIYHEINRHPVVPEIKMYKDEIAAIIRKNSLPAKKYPVRDVYQNILYNRNNVLGRLWQIKIVHDCTIQYLEHLRKLRIRKNVDYC